jgi:lipopolysaccharide cholinephosphotransferase
MKEYLVAIIALLLVYVIYKSYIFKKVFNRISVSKQNSLYYLLTILLYYFKKYNIKYWIMSGTLLGGVRNDPGGMLYWDDDVDLGVFAEELPKIKKMLNDPILKKLIGWNEFFGGYQITTNTGDMHIDLFVYHGRLKTVKTGLTTWYYPQGPHFQDEYIKSKDEIFPTLTKKFWNTTVEYPRESVLLLKRGYGDDVLDYVHKWNHNSKNYSKTKITHKDRIPLHHII